MYSNVYSNSNTVFHKNKDVYNLHNMNAENPSISHSDSNLSNSSHNVFHKHKDMPRCRYAQYLDGNSLFSSPSSSNEEPRRRRSQHHNRRHRWHSRQYGRYNSSPASEHRHGRSHHSKLKSDDVMIFDPADVDVHTFILWFNQIAALYRDEVVCIVLSWCLQSKALE